MVTGQNEIQIAVVASPPAHKRSECVGPQFISKERLVAALNFKDYLCERTVWNKSAIIDGSKWRQRRLRTNISHLSAEQKVWRVKERAKADQGVKRGTLTKADRDKIVDEIDAKIGIVKHKFQRGESFGRLTIDAPCSNHRGEPAFSCRCVCGNMAVATPDALTSGKKRSCGCLRLDLYQHFPVGSGESALGRLFETFRCRSKAEGQAFEFDLPYFKQLVCSPCTYCGAAPKQICTYTLPSSRRKDVALRNGIDRVNSSIGYTLANSVSCCKQCNYAKRDMKLSEFVAWALRFTDGVLPSSDSLRNNMAEKDLHRVYAKSAKERKLQFDFSVDEFTELAKQKCHYCAAPPYRNYHYIGRYFTCSGADRKDSTLGYTKSNTVPCCTECNMAKRHMSVDQFLEWTKRLSLHLRVKLTAGDFKLSLLN